MKRCLLLKDQRCWTFECSSHVAAEYPGRPNVVGRRENESWGGNDAISKAESVETVRADPEENGLRNALEELADMLETSNGKNI